MRVLAMSDSHGDTEGLKRLLEAVWRQCGPIDAYVHLGDGARDFMNVERIIWDRDPMAQRAQVRGNCDLGLDLPGRMTIRVGEYNIFLTHGHAYGVKDGYDAVDAAGDENLCEITLFGHTHAPCCEKRRTLLVNPGSARNGRIALITDENGAPGARLLKFDID